jgi:hypothetical protein
MGEGDAKGDAAYRNIQGHGNIEVCSRKWTEISFLIPAQECYRSDIENQRKSKTGQQNLLKRKTKIAIKGRTTQY